MTSGSDRGQSVAHWIRLGTPALRLSEPNVPRVVSSTRPVQAGNFLELWAMPRGRQSVEIRAVRHLRGRGSAACPFFLPFIPGSAAETVREHLRQLLASIEGTNIEAGEEI